MPIGAHNPMRDVVYLTRNVFFECAGRPEQSADVALDVIRARWSEGEPAVISTHRANYVSLDPARPESGRAELRRLLEMLTAETPARFITSAELGDIFRRGWSLREMAGGYILRVWSGEPDEVRVPGPDRTVRALPDGAEYAGESDGLSTVFDLPPGDYRLNST